MSETLGSAKRAWSPQDLAEAWGVTVQYVRRLVREGAISHYRTALGGRRIFIPVAEAEALLEGRHPAVQMRERSPATSG